MSDWEIDYEQCPDPAGRWVYKFDHEPQADGRWHRLNAQSSALYCICGGYLRFVDAQNSMPANELAGLLAQLDAAGALKTDGELEIVIRRKQSAFELWSYWLKGDESIVFHELSSETWNDAFRRL
jgi:hypothetical protein